MNKVYYSNYLKQQYKVNKNLFSPKFKITVLLNEYTCQSFVCSLQTNTQVLKLLKKKKYSPALPSNLIQSIEKDASKFSVCFKMR